MDDRHLTAMLLTIEDAAELLTVSARTVRRMIADGEIPHIRIRRAIRIPRAGLVGIMDGCQWQAPPPLNWMHFSTGGTATASRMESGR